MFYQQVSLNKNNNGYVNLEVPDIHNGKIMDKCVIDKVASEATTDFQVLKQGMNDCRKTINKTFANVANGITDIKNNVKYLESILETKNRKQTNTLFEETFSNAINIDMSSDVDINFSSHYLTLPKIKSVNVPFANIFIPKRMNYEALTLPYETQCETINIEVPKGTEMICTYDLETYINSIRVEMNCETLVDYEIYTVNTEGAYTLLDSGSTYSTIECYFNKILTDKIVVKFKSRNKEEVKILVNYITANLNTYGKTGEFKSKVIDIYNSKPELNLNIQSNNRDDIKAYIGFINTKNEIVWNSADDTIRFNLENKVKTAIDKSNTFFGTSVGTNKLLTTVKKDIIPSSTKVYSGFNMWHKTLIEEAFMNEDLSKIDYGPKDVKKREFVDIDDSQHLLKAGQLIVFEQTIVSSKNIDISIPVLTCVAQGKENRCDMFRYSITLNGERLDDFANLDEYLEGKLKKGKNVIQIIMNLKMKNDESTYEVMVTNPVNLRKYSDMIYFKELEEATIPKVTKDLALNYFAISGDKIIVNNVDKTVDRFLVKYSTLLNTDIHYKTYLGYKMKAIVMLKMYAKNNYSNIVVNKISIKD